MTWFGGQKLSFRTYRGELPISRKTNMEGLKMFRRYLAWPGMMAVVLLAAGPVSAQAQTAAAKAKTPAAAAKSAPKTPWGAPDLQGIWDRHTITPLQRNETTADKDEFSEEEVAKLEATTAERNDVDREKGTTADVGRAYNQFWWDRATKATGNRTALIVQPADGRIPALTPAAEERRKQEANQPTNRSLGSGGRGTAFWGDRSLWERCLTQGSTRLGAGAYNANFMIVQSADTVVILHEQIHEARIIPLDPRPHLSQGVRQWMGDSRGRWEGDTLVVDTTNFTDKTNFQGSAENLHMIERIRRVDADTISYVVTFEDPTTWTKSWTVDLPMPKTQGDMYEYACHEGNYGLYGILSGSRAEEKEAAEAARKGSR